MTRSDNGVWLALGATAVLGAAGMVRRGSRAHRGRGGRFVPAWVTTGRTHLPRHWRYDSGMGGFIWRPLGGVLGDPELQYAIYGGEGYGRGTWSAYVWHEDESRGVTAQDSTQPWHAWEAVRADLQARGYSYDSRIGQAKKRLTLADVPPRGSRARQDLRQLGVYVSPLSSELAARLLPAIRERLPAACARIRATGRPADSCDANAEAWSELLSDFGAAWVDGLAVLEAPIWHQDSQAMRDRIGHDWVEIPDTDGSVVIIDGSIRQFAGQIPQFVAYRGSTARWVGDPPVRRPPQIISFAPGTLLHIREGGPLADVPPRGAQNKKKWPWPKGKGWQRLAAGRTVKIGHYLYEGRRINVFVEKPNPTTWAVVERFQGPGPEPGGPGMYFGPIHKAPALPPRIFGGWLFPGGAARAAARLIEYMDGDVTNPPPPREIP